MHGEAVQVLAAPAERGLQHRVEAGEGKGGGDLQLPPDQRADPGKDHPQPDTVPGPSFAAVPASATVSLARLVPSINIIDTGKCPGAARATRDGMARPVPAGSPLSQETGDAAMAKPATGIRLGHLAAEFLDDLERAGKSPHTIRGYRSDLAAFRRHYRGLPEDIDPGVLRGYLHTLTGKAPGHPGPA